MSLLSKKFTVSPYKDVDFRDDPYDTVHKFSVYIPKPKDYIAEALDKFQKKEDLAKSKNSFRNSAYNTLNVVP